MPEGKVVQMVLPFERILSDHPNQWVLIHVIDAEKEIGSYVISAPKFNAPEIQAALRRELDAGHDTALRFAGSLVPEGAIVVF